MWNLLRKQLAVIQSLELSPEVSGLREQESKMDKGLWNLALASVDKKIFDGSSGNPREDDGTPLQFSCLENPMDGGAW